MSHQLTLNQYQVEAAKSARYLMAGYPFAALGEESGEVLGKIAKFSRKNDVGFDNVITLAREMDDPLKVDLAKELGDVLWQVASCARELGMSLEEIAVMNLDKLSGRTERGTIVGEGDDR